MSVGRVIAWGDSVSTTSDSWLRQALPDDYALLAMPCGGEAAWGFVQPTHREWRTRLSVCPGANFVESYGINDHGNQDGESPGAEDLNQDRLTLWRLARRQGAAKVFANTSTPLRTSSDSFATLAGQSATLPARESHFTGHRTWMMDGAPISATTGLVVATGTVGALRTAVVEWNGSSHTVTGSQDAGHPLTAVFDTAGQVLTFSGGLWKWIVSPLTVNTDGIHPSTAGMARMALAVKLDLFA